MAISECLSERGDRYIYGVVPVYGVRLVIAARGGATLSRALCINEHSRTKNHQYNNRKRCAAKIKMGLGGFSWC